jgi:hypothetical protein
MALCMNLLQDAEKHVGGINPTGLTVTRFGRVGASCGRRKRLGKHVCAVKMDAEEGAEARAAHFLLGMDFFCYDRISFVMALHNAERMFTYDTCSKSSASVSVVYVAKRLSSSISSL